MILRLATPADAAALALLGQEAFVAKFADLYSPEDLSAFLKESHSEAARAAELADNRLVTCLAEHETGLGGYCKLSLECGWPEMARGERVIELKQLYTDPALVGRGVGSQLMDWALGEARSRGADEIQLSVWSGNTGAHRFYYRYGFSKVGETTFRVGNQLDHEFVFAVLL